MWTNPVTSLNQLQLNKLTAILLMCLSVTACRSAQRPAAGIGGSETSVQATGIAVTESVVVGAERTQEYFPLLEGKKVGIMTNHTGLIGKSHIVDSLVMAGINLKAVFAPEHGFRGSADAGENVDSYTDTKTGLKVISVYGSSKKPKATDIKALDVLIFDIQDVGLRYYTYLSSMHYLMEACADNGKELIILDRPNPNGFYIDGPILQERFKSFVGMHPIPVVHGMTLGELAQMINGEGWLDGGKKCKLTVIKCQNYTHQTRYELPVRPSPNLPNMRSIYLYSSLCFFEGTPLSIGRGTEFPFQVYGHPDLPETGFSFTPKSTEGAKDPVLNGKKCNGVDLREAPSNEVIWANGVDLSYLVESYAVLGGGEKFFLPIFNLLTGVPYVKEMIIAGATAEEIESRWTGDVEKFKLQRKPYLLYAE